MVIILIEVGNGINTGAVGRGYGRRRILTVAVLVTGHPANIIEYFGIYKSKKYD